MKGTIPHLSSSYHVRRVGTEESGVVSLLDHNESDAWLVALLQFHTRLTHRTQLMLEYLQYKCMCVHVHVAMEEITKEGSWRKVT